VAVDGQQIVESAPGDPAQQEGTPQEQPGTQPAEATPQANALAGRKTPWDNRAYTQATQIASTVRRELGLPDTARPEEVQAAIAALREPRGVDEPTYDPAAQERISVLEQRVWNAARETHGDEVVDAAETLWKAGGSQGDPYEFMQQFMAAVERVTFDPNDPAAVEQRQQMIPDIAGGDPPLVPVGNNNAPRPDTTGGKRGTGDVFGWIRDRMATGQG
jgi:hypothetical protein